MMKIDNLLDKIGFKIENTQNVELALTHSSFSSENNLGTLENNERLEFLGDAVLKLACSEFLYKTFPKEREGVLSKFRSILVSDKLLAEYAGTIALRDYIKIGYNEEKTGGRKRLSIAACAFEALLGALYLETSQDELYKFLEPFFINAAKDISQNLPKLNAKATLQEYTQKMSKDLPEYMTLKESGKAHEKCFEIAVLYHGGELARGFGRTKKEAEQEAAYRACVGLGVIDE